MRVRRRVVGGARVRACRQIMEGSTCQEQWQLSHIRQLAQMDQNRTSNAACDYPPAKETLCSDGDASLPARRVASS